MRGLRPGGVQVGAACVLVLVSGCLAQAPADPPSGSAGCALRYPDGTPVDCGTSAFSDVPVLPDGPAASTGWTCRDDSTSDEGNHYQIWVAADGQVGVRWDLRAAPLGANGFLLATLYQEQQDQIILLPYQDVAFAAFPQAPSLGSPVELHILAYQVTAVRSNAVDAYDPEHWQDVGGVALRASTFGADPWIVVEAPGPDGPVHLDLNRPDTTEAGKPMWRARGNQVHALGEDGPWYVAEMAGGGAKFPDRDPVQMRANPGFCYAEDPPVDVPPIAAQPMGARPLRG